MKNHKKQGKMLKNNIRVHIKWQNNEENNVNKEYDLPSSNVKNTEKHENQETNSQKNALKSAKDYLRTMSFSKKGLIRQLEFEGYSNEDAKYAVDKIETNWNEQALKTAKSYLNTSAFSYQGLID